MEASGPRSPRDSADMTWSCALCTLENDGLFETCEACAAPREYAWQCTSQSCRNLNTVPLVPCAACGLPDPASLFHSAASASGPAPTFASGPAPTFASGPAPTSTPASSASALPSTSAFSASAAEPFASSVSGAWTCVVCTMHVSDSRMTACPMCESPRVSSAVQWQCFKCSAPNTEIGGCCVRCGEPDPATGLLLERQPDPPSSSRVEAGAGRSNTEPPADARDEDEAPAFDDSCLKYVTALQGAPVDSLSGAWTCVCSNVMHSTNRCNVCGYVDRSFQPQQLPHEAQQYLYKNPGAADRQRLAAASGTPLPWTCSTCSFLNAAGDHSCAICMQPNLKLPRTQPAPAFSAFAGHGGYGAKQTVSESRNLVDTHGNEHLALASWQSHGTPPTQMHPMALPGEVAEFQSRHPGATFVFLFHGSDKTAVDGIAARGFDPSRRGTKHGQSYGQGEYFALGSDVAGRYGDYIVMTMVALKDGQFSYYQAARVLVSHDHNNVHPVAWFHRDGSTRRATWY